MSETLRTTDEVIVQHTTRLEVARTTTKLQQKERSQGLNQVRCNGLFEGEHCST